MNTTKPKVAIIEDDLAIVQMYRTKFEHLGYEIQTAGDGATGLALIASFVPDCVLLDLMMPGVNGLDMLSELRRIAGGRDVKIIVLTNMGDTETATRVFKMGANDYLVKAEVTPSEVEARVKRLIDA